MRWVLLRALRFRPAVASLSLCVLGAASPALRPLRCRLHRCLATIRRLASSPPFADTSSSRCIQGLPTAPFRAASSRLPFPTLRPWECRCIPALKSADASAKRPPSARPHPWPAGALGSLRIQGPIRRPFCAGSWGLIPPCCGRCLASSRLHSPHCGLGNAAAFPR